MGERMINYQKYRNKKTEIKGIKFDSKLEGNIYLKILELKQTHKFDFRLQPGYILVDGFVHSGKKFRAITYRADFEITIKDHVYTLDAKGIETQVFLMKKKLFLKEHGREIITIKSVKQFNDWFRETYYLGGK